MGIVDTGGVAVMLAPASLGGLTTAVGRLLEPDLLVLSSHGGHHLFINRIPPRLAKEDVEKIILAQLRLHPFVLQVSKCSVIPQNSLKNKGYGFITLDGSPSPSDIGAIADSLNNKLQVGCRTLGVRVCTDCHSCVEDDGCASSSHSSTPPYELDMSLQVAGDAHLSLQCSEEAIPGEADARASSPSKFVAPSSTPADIPHVLQADILQMAVAVLATQGLSTPSNGPPRRRVARHCDVRPEHGRIIQHPHPHQHQHLHNHKQQQQFNGSAGGTRLRGDKGHCGVQGITHSAGRQRRHSLDTISSQALKTKNSTFQGANAALPAAVDPAQSPTKPCEALRVPSPSEPALNTPQQRRRDNDPAVMLRQHECQKKDDLAGTDASQHGVVSGSPRSFSSYNSTSGSGPGSASNSAPGSVSGSGSGFSGSGSAFSAAPRNVAVSGVSASASVNGWCSGGGSIRVRSAALSAPAPTKQPHMDTSSASEGIRKGAVSDEGFASVSPADVARRRAPLLPDQLLLLQHSQQCRAREGAQWSPVMEQQHPGRSQGPQQQQQLTQFSSQLMSASSQQPQVFKQLRRPQSKPQKSRTQASESMAKPSGFPAYGGSRSASLAGVSVQAGTHTFTAKGTPGTARVVSPPVDAWAHTNMSRMGPPVTANLHSASAPSSSSWYLQQYHHQRQERHRNMSRREPPNPHNSKRVDGRARGNANMGASVASVGGAGRGFGGGGRFAAAVGRYGERQSPAPEQVGKQELASAGYGWQPALTIINQAWMNLPANDNVEGHIEGHGFSHERRSSFPVGPAVEVARLASCSQPGGVYYEQYQQQPQLTLSAQSTPQELCSTFYPSDLVSDARLQLLKPQMVVRAGLILSQQQAGRFHFFSPASTQPTETQQQQEVVRNRQHSQQRKGPSQKNVPVVGPPVLQGYPDPIMYPLHVQPPQQSPQHASAQQPPQQPQTASQQQVPPLQGQQQQQPACFVQSFEGRGAGLVRPEPRQAPSFGGSSSVAPNANTSLRPQLPFHMLGMSGMRPDRFMLGSSAPQAHQGWRTSSLELDFDLYRDLPGVGDLKLSTAAATHSGQLGAAASEATAVSALSVRSAEGFMDRNSSDPAQDPDAEYPDSADLDPLDLEPMILQLLGNDEDDADVSGRAGGLSVMGSGGGGDQSSNQPATVPSDTHRSVPSDHLQHSINNQSHPPTQVPQHQHYHKRFRTGPAKSRQHRQLADCSGRRSGNPTLATAASVRQQTHGVVLANGPEPQQGLRRFACEDMAQSGTPHLLTMELGPEMYGPQQQGWQQAQPLRHGQQNGSSAGGGGDACAVTFWSLPAKDSSSSSVAGGSPGSFPTGHTSAAAVATLPSTGPMTVLQSCNHGAVGSSSAPMLPGPKAPPAPSAPHNADALVCTSRTAAVTAAASIPLAGPWARVSDAGLPGQGPLNSVGSSLGAGWGYAGGMAAGADQHGASNRGGRPAGGGRGAGGRVVGGRGGRHFTGGGSGYGGGGGRSSAARSAAVAAGDRGYVPGVRRNSGGWVSMFEPQGSVTASLPNASLMAIMQRANI